MIFTFLYIIVGGLAVAIGFTLAARFFGVPGFSKPGKNDADKLLGIEKALSRILAKMGCELEWKHSGTSRNADFVYDRTMLNVSIGSKSPFVQIMRPGFYTASMANISNLRAVCNKMNIQSEDCYFIYTIDNDDYKIYVHVVMDVHWKKPLCLKDMKGLVAKVFEACDRFSAFADDYLSDAAKMRCGDFEKEQADLNHELSFIKKQELSSDSDTHVEDEGKVGKFGIGTLLSKAIGMNGFEPLGMVVMSSKRPPEKVAKEQVMDYCLSTPLVSEGKFVDDKVVLQVDYSDERVPNQKRTIVIVLSQAEETKRTLFYRAMLAVLPLSQSDAAMDDNRKEPIVAKSVLVGYDKLSAKQRFDEYRYMWLEAKACEDKGKECELNADQWLLRGSDANYLGFCIYEGSILARSGRFAEALPYLEYAFDKLKGTYDDDNASSSERFIEVCYLAGLCYSGLEQYKMASYYLELTLHSHKISHTEEYVNCLVNSGDPRAASMINILLSNVEHVGDGGQCSAGQDDSIKAFIDFLKRRKSYIYVSNKRYGEAEAMLKKMLDDPDNRDYAVGELAFINKARRMDGETKLT